MEKKPIFDSVANISVPITAKEIHRRYVVKNGTGAQIVFLKQHIGKEVVIIVEEE